MISVTLWKSKNISATQILREIEELANLEFPKRPFLTIYLRKYFDFVIFSLYKLGIDPLFQNQNSDAIKLSKMAILDTPNSLTL